MATPSSPTEEERKSDTGVYECNICFEQAKEAVVSMCGHLFWLVMPIVCIGIFF